MRTGVFERWKDVQLGRSEDQPVIFALLIVLIAVTLYLFV
jgi:hypothetical protein